MSARRPPPREHKEERGEPPPLKIIATLDDLLLLPRDRRVNGFGIRMPVRLELAGMPRSGQLHAQQRLNRLQSRCGCFAGAMALLASLVLGSAYVYVENAGHVSWRLLPAVAAVLVAAFSIGFASKMLALAATRWQFARECRVQHRVLVRLLQDSNEH